MLCLPLCAQLQTQSEIGVQDKVFVTKGLEVTVVGVISPDAEAATEGHWFEFWTSRNPEVPPAGARLSSSPMCSRGRSPTGAGTSGCALQGCSTWKCRRLTLTCRLSLPPGV